MIRLVNESAISVQGFHRFPYPTWMIEQSVFASGHSRIPAAGNSFRHYSVRPLMKALDVFEGLGKEVPSVYKLGVIETYFEDAEWRLSAAFSKHSAPPEDLVVR